MTGSLKRSSLITASLIQALRKDSLQRQEGAAASAPWTPADLFSGSEVGDYWDFSDLSTMFQDTGKTTPVTTNGDVVGCVVGQRGTIDLIQGTTSEKPLYATGVGSNSQNGIQTVSSSLRRYLEATGVPFVGTDQSIAISMHTR